MQALRAQKNDAETWSAMGQLSMRTGKHDEGIRGIKVLVLQRIQTSADCAHSSATGTFRLIVA